MISDSWKGSVGSHGKFQVAVVCPSRSISNIKLEMWARKTTSKGMGTKGNFNQLY